MLDSFESSLQFDQYFGRLFLFDFKGHVPIRPKPNSD
jgi:hypothetical protein